MSFKCTKCGKQIEKGQTEGLRKKFRYYKDILIEKPRKDLVYIERVCMACFKRYGEEI